MALRAAEQDPNLGRKALKGRMEQLVGLECGLGIRALTLGFDDRILVT